MTAPVWLFDGHCVLCSGAVRCALAHERPDREPMRFVAITSDEGRKLARAHGLDPDDPQSFLFIADGRVHRESGGVLVLARHLTGPFGWLRHFGWVPRWARDPLYRLIARHRYRLFGRTESCMVPAPAVRNRFVL